MWVIIQIYFYFSVASSPENSKNKEDSIDLSEASDGPGSIVNSPTEVLVDSPIAQNGQETSKFFIFFDNKIVVINISNKTYYQKPKLNFMN